jgi:hypothetical protein
MYFHDVGGALSNRPDDLGQQTRIVLVIGVHHDDDLGAGAQCLRVTGLLVGAVSVVAIVQEQFQVQLAGDGDGVVGAAVIDKDDHVEVVLRQLGERHAQRAPGVVGGHHDHDLRPVFGRSFPGLTGCQLFCPTHVIRAPVNRGSIPYRRVLGQPVCCGVRHNQLLTLGFGA